MVSRSENLLLPRHFYIAMVQHAQAESPNECCGLFAGVREGDVLRVLARHPLVNEAASPIEFFSQPRSMFDAVKAMRKDGHKILAIYHSHPTSEPIPSKTDLERNFSEDVINFIIGVSVAKPIRNAARRIVEGGALAVLAMRQRSLAGAASAGVRACLVADIGLIRRGCLADLQLTSHCRVCGRHVTITTSFTEEQ
jgi:[CysO sulfur-carrier protein]-S-L-cysteine hydrolase